MSELRRDYWWFDTCSNIRLEGTHTIKCWAAMSGNKGKEASFDLDRILGEENGQFKVGGTGFSAKAKDVELDWEGAPGIDNAFPVLYARMNDPGGFFWTKPRVKMSLHNLLDNIEGVLQPAK